MDSLRGSAHQRHWEYLLKLKQTLKKQICSIIHSWMSHNHIHNSSAQISRLTTIFIVITLRSMKIWGIRFLKRTLWQMADIPCLKGRRKTIQFYSEFISIPRVVTFFSSLIDWFVVARPGVTGSHLGAASDMLHTWRAIKSIRLLGGT